MHDPRVGTYVLNTNAGILAVRLGVMGLTPPPGKRWALRLQGVVP